MKGVEMKCVCKISKSMVEQGLCNTTRQRREKTVREGITETEKTDKLWMIIWWQNIGSHKYTKHWCRQDNGSSISLFTSPPQTTLHLIQSNPLLSQLHHTFKLTCPYTHLVLLKMLLSLVFSFTCLPLHTLHLLSSPDCFFLQGSGLRCSIFF